MAGEIEQAVNALNQRKAAILGDQPEREVDERDLVTMMSGFDLDPAEVIEAAKFGTSHGTTMMVVEAQNGNLPENSFGVIFLDGIALGLLIAEARARRRSA